MASQCSGGTGQIFDYHTLHTTIYSGRNLVAKNKSFFGGKPWSDPCVKVHYGDMTIGKTSVVYNSLNPSWARALGETMTYSAKEINISLGDEVECRITSGILYNMGVVTASVPKEFNEKLIEWYPVGKGSGKRLCKDASGDLRVGVEIRDEGHHYELAQQALKKIAFLDPTAFLQTMQSRKKRDDFLGGLWRKVHKRCDKHGLPNFSISNVQVSIKAQASKTPIVFITMPPPEALTQAYYVAAMILDGAKTGEKIRYFVLQKGVQDSQGIGDLCEWKDGGNLHFKYHGRDVKISEERFLKEIQRMESKFEEKIQKEKKEAMPPEQSQRRRQSKMMISASSFKMGKDDEENGDDGEGKCKLLHVTIYAGRNLVAMDSNPGFGLIRPVGTSDPYIEIYYRGNKVGTTTTQKRTLNPIYSEPKGESFHITLKNYKPSDMVHCRIIDDDLLGSDDPMGTVSLKIPEDICEEAVQWYPVGKGSGKFLCEDATGDLKVGLELAMNDANKARELSLGSSVMSTEMALSKEKRRRKDLQEEMFKIKEVLETEEKARKDTEAKLKRVEQETSTLDNRLNREIARSKELSEELALYKVKDEIWSEIESLSDRNIIVTILKGKGLVALDTTFGTASSDPYVKIYYGQQQIGKTSVVKKSLAPKWGTGKDGETFKLPLRQIQEKTKVQCIIFDHNTIGSSVPMGTVSIPLPEKVYHKEVKWYKVGKGRGDTKTSKFSGELKVGVEVRFA